MPLILIIHTCFPLSCHNDRRSKYNALNKFHTNTRLWKCYKYETRSMICQNSTHCLFPMIEKSWNQRHRLLLERFEYTVPRCYLEDLVGCRNELPMSLLFCLCSWIESKRWWDPIQQRHRLSWPRPGVLLLPVDSREPGIRRSLYLIVDLLQKIIRKD